MAKCLCAHTKYTPVFGHLLRGTGSIRGGGNKEQGIANDPTIFDVATRSFCVSSVVPCPQPNNSRPILDGDRDFPTFVNTTGSALAAEKLCIGAECKHLPEYFLVARKGPGGNLPVLNLRLGVSIF